MLTAACSGNNGPDTAMGRSLGAFRAVKITTDTIPPADFQVDRLLTALDSLLVLPETPFGFESDARDYVRYLGIFLGDARVTPEQTDRVVARLDRIEARYPILGSMVDDQRFRARNLIPGKIAPNIVGTDTQGKEFKLADYRGNIVVLIFSGDWCAPCREEYPYQRRMLERYRDDKVVRLGVNADYTLEKMQEVREQEGLDYRTWWDGPPIGPISASWKVWAFPEIYVLDTDGVILHVEERGDDLIEAVDKALARIRKPSGKAGTLPSS